ncbi:dihydrodipicolinate synthase family protein [Streptomyces sp. NPDC005438]|uniref:dihydrodipicolinate synthase family protein n=1 Tax=Streptomyces sp. NPDC005438 TaxID=3156880 RepID=UPI0033AF364C
MWDHATFGRTAAAMITPFTPDGELDPPGARRLARHLVDRGGCDALVLHDTTGEAATTCDQEKLALLEAVRDEVGDRARITTGVSGGDTRRAVELARRFQQAGAHGLLVSAPPFPTGRLAVRRHLVTVADATELPVMLHDRGTALETDTLLALAEHPRVQGVLDRSGDPSRSGRVLAETDLAYYAGGDEWNLPLRSLGAVGYVSWLANVAGPLLRRMWDHEDRGDHPAALALHRRLLPLIGQVGPELPAPVAVKALFQVAGLPGGPVRGPLAPPEPRVTEQLVTALEAALAEG